MVFALLILLASVQDPAVEVWSGGDDGLTQRFAVLFRAATHDIKRSDRRHLIRAIVEQIMPKRNGDVRVAVSFDRDGRHVGTSRCVARENDLARCAARAGALAKHLVAHVR
jgi:hypothetical protein